MKTFAKYAVLFLLVNGLGCAAKKHETRLNGIQKQISYLSDAHNQLSMKLSEIQDSLLVLQNQVEITKGNSRRTVKPSSTKKIKTSMKTPENPVGKEAKKTASQEVPPPLMPGLASQELAGAPGEVFRLKSGDGFIKIGGKTGAATSGKKKAFVKVKIDPKASPKEIYEKAYKEYSKRKFDTAIKSFSGFLDFYPEHDLSDNAVYWIGECFVGKGQYALALPEFQRISIQYPNGNKVPDALLMSGICFDKLNDSDSAVRSWKKLVKLFPDTMAAKKAKRKLDTLNN